ncbi:barstar family protein [Micromonospora sp. NPDC049275]|uniref:barstar family protein n=1 Tax=Micromonospora sp. NPDC049275 TaxID=3364268 RepID=UPI0037200FF0
MTREDDPWIVAEVAELRKQGGRVAKLHAHELRQPASLFAAFARELSFPGYFGHNWDALVDCLHDWHGHDAADQTLVVLIEEADELIDAEFLGLFVSALCQAAWHANRQLDADGIPHEDRPPFALHFVFLLARAEPAAWAEPVAAGPDVRVALTVGRLSATLIGETAIDS